ncbi:MAG: hypothetical protein V8T31_03915 [Lachnospiraceae bacterium]
MQQAEPGQDEIIEVEGDTQLEEPVEIDNSVDEDAAVGMQMADQGIQVQSAEDDAVTAYFVRKIYRWDNESNFHWWSRCCKKRRWINLYDWAGNIKRKYYRFYALTI